MDLKKAADLMQRRLQGNLDPEDAADLHIPPPAVDLLAVPREDWKSLVGSPIKVPAEISAYIEGQSEFTQLEREALEDRVAAHFGVTAPYYVTFEQGPPAELWLGLER